MLGCKSKSKEEQWFYWCHSGLPGWQADWNSQDYLGGARCCLQESDQHAWTCASNVTYNKFAEYEKRKDTCRNSWIWVYLGGLGWDYFQEVWGSVYFQGGSG